jgi:hypothetical protein
MCCHDYLRYVTPEVESELIISAALAMGVATKYILSAYSAETFNFSYHTFVTYPIVVVFTPISASLISFIF